MNNLVKFSVILVLLFCAEISPQSGSRFSLQPGVNSFIPLNKIDESNDAIKKLNKQLYKDGYLIVEKIWQDWNGSIWVNYLKDSYTYDINENNTQMFREIWNGSFWENFSRNNILYTANNLPDTLTNQDWFYNQWNDDRRSQWDIYAKIVNWNWNGVTDVEIVDDNIPSEFTLSQNYPNPFNPNTKIKYQIPELSFINIKVYDVLGNEVAALVNEGKPAGEYEVEFNSNGLTSGIYFYQLKAGSFVETKKMVLMK